MSPPCEHHDEIVGKLGEISNQNGTKYVTFKWLIVSSFSMLASAVLISISVLSFSLGSINRDMDNKVNRDTYKALCTDIEEIKQTVIINSKNMDAFNRNQLLVMRRLKIEPVPIK